jgi:hypothetical protein
MSILHLENESSAGVGSSVPKGDVKSFGGSMINVKRISHATFDTPDLDRQIAYFTQIAGLVLAERENGRAFLATKVGDLAVQLEKGDQARCTSFPGRAGDRV